MRVHSGGGSLLAVGDGSGGSSYWLQMRAVARLRGSPPSNCGTKQAAMSAMCLTALPAWLPVSNFELGFLNPFHNAL